MSRLLFTCVLLLAGAAHSADVEPIRPDWQKPNYDASKIAPYALEDPLTFCDGRKLKDASEWPARRREILGIFAREMFGQEPPKPEAVVVEKFDEGVTLGGFGIRRQYRMWFKADRKGPAIDWLVLLPRYAKKPAPPILFLNYGGNHELIRDPQVTVSKAWMAFRKGNRAEPEARGKYENMNNVEFVFPAHMILARGYALVSACYADVSPDACHGQKRPPEDAFKEGVFTLWPPRDESRDDNPTAIGAWAWALSRGLDLAERIPEIDAAKAVATGYSRLGKTALLAAARDERFAACVPNQTGGGGCPLAKRDFGENVATETRMFPHWYCRAYAKYAKNPAKLLTFDQHLLLASLAPRALMVQGYDNPWFDTEGEYLACRAASPVWTFLGKPGLPDRPFPPDYDTSCVGARLAYVRRTEGHGHAAHDWTWLMDFTDRLFASEAGGASAWRPKRRLCGFNLLGMFCKTKMQDGDPRIFGYFPEDRFRWMRDWGFNFARLPLDYRFFVKDGDWMRPDEAQLKKLDAAVEYGRKYGIHVNIDFHRAPGYCCNLPKEPQSLFVSPEPLTAFTNLWATLARRYRGRPNDELTFDLVNEPAKVAGYHCTPSNYAVVARAALAAIHAADPNRFVMSDGFKWGQVPVMELRPFSPMTGESIHCYSPGAVTHFGVPDRSNPPVCPPWPPKGYASGRDWLMENFFAAWKDVERDGTFYHLGEFGTHYMVPHATALAWMEDLLKICQEKGLGWAIWNLDGKFGIMDSGRTDWPLEDFEGHKLDRQALELLQRYARDRGCACGK